MWGTQTHYINKIKYQIWIFYTLSGRIGKVIASHTAVARSSRAEVGLIYTMHVALRGYCP